MVTGTSTVDIQNYVGLYLDTNGMTFSGPVVGVWTITSPLDISQVEFDAGIASTAAYVVALNNKAILLAKGIAALAVNATFMALAAPTNAQTLAQVKALTKQNNAVIKLLAEDLSNTTGT